MCGQRVDSALFYNLWETTFRAATWWTVQHNVWQFLNKSWKQNLWINFCFVAAVKLVQQFATLLQCLCSVTISRNHLKVYLLVLSSFNILRPHVAWINVFEEHFRIYILTVFLAEWWEVGTPSILEGDLPYMGLRERGRVAISCPVVLQPAPVSTFRCFKVSATFLSGFVTAFLWIVWLLWD